MKFTISNEHDRKLSVVGRVQPGSPHVAIIFESGSGTEVMALTIGEAMLFSRMLEQARNDVIEGAWSNFDEENN